MTQPLWASTITNTADLEVEKRSNPPRRPMVRYKRDERDSGAVMTSA